jgi:hypothetical protein
MWLTFMNADSNTPSVVASNDSTGFVCLADSQKYKTLDDRRRALLKYWYALATVPFFLSIVIGVGVFPRLVPDTAFWAGVAETLIFGALGWTFIVIFYALFVCVSWFLVRCPRCGWRFGLGDRCGSCDLPRTRG